MRHIQDLQSARRQWSAFGAKPPQVEMFALLRNSGHNLAAAVGALDELLRSWPEDRGLHTICAVVTAESLEHRVERDIAKIGGEMTPVGE